MYIFSLHLDIKNNYPGQPINIFTANNYIARFISGSGCPTFATPSTPGDGLAIRSLTGNSVYNLDMWVDPGNSVNQHIRWGQWGLAEARNSYFTITGYQNGLWFDANSNGPVPGGNARTIFNHNGIEVARFGLNDFMRIGTQGIIPFDAARRLEIVDPSNVPQFRITQTQLIGINKFCDFQVTSNGDLAISPFNSSIVNA